MSLACNSFMTLFEHLFEQLNEDTSKLVIAEVLKKMTYEEVVNHPVMMEHYKKTILPLLNNDPYLTYLISNTESSPIIRNYFDDTDYLMENNGMIARWERYYMTEDNKMVIISEYWNLMAHFDLSYQNIKSFDFQRDIIDVEMSPDNIYLLVYAEREFNPGWNYKNPPEAQVLFKGQREIKWDDVKYV